MGRGRSYGRGSARNGVTLSPDCDGLGAAWGGRGSMLLLLLLLLVLGVVVLQASHGLLVGRFLLL